MCLSNTNEFTNESKYTEPYLHNLALVITHLRLYDYARCLSLDSDIRMLVTNKAPKYHAFFDMLLVFALFSLFFYSKNFCNAYTRLWQPSILEDIS